MSLKKDQNSSENNYYQKLIKNNITPLDLFIITKLNKGISLDELIKLAEKEFKIKDIKKVIEKKIKRFSSINNSEEKLLLYPNPQYVIDPTKIYDKIFLVLIKANTEKLKERNIRIGVPEIYKTIIENNYKARFGSPIKQLYITNNWMFDFAGVVFENNLSKFNAFKDYLIKEEIVKTIDIVNVDSDKGFFYNPVSLPDFHDLKEFVIKYKEKLNSMADELSEHDLESMKTTKYFKTGEFELRAISGENEGERYPINLPEIKIGRYQDNNIILQELIVSRRHAKITKIGDMYIFNDESTNGSFVNNNQIHYDEIELHDGDTIRIGNTKFLFTRSKK